MSNKNVQGGSDGHKMSDMLSGRGVYLLLAICLVGSGIAAWSAVSDSFFTGDDPPPLASSDTDWGFPILEEVELRDPSQPLPSSEAPSSSPPSSDSSEPDRSTEVLEPQPEQPVSLFILPAEGEILAAFSQGNLVKNTILDEWRTHNGVDIRAERGSEIYAISAGKVVDVRSDPLWGYVVEIDHGDGMTAIYCGLGSDIRVSRGDQVRTRAVLGSLDVVPVEADMEPHLHFEIKVNGRYVEPFAALGKS